MTRVLVVEEPGIALGLKRDWFVLPGDGRLDAANPDGAEFGSGDALLSAQRHHTVGSPPVDDMAVVAGVVG